MMNYMLKSSDNPIFDVKRNQVLTESDSGYLEYLVDQEYDMMAEI